MSKKVMENLQDNVKWVESVLVTRRMNIAHIERDIQEHQRIIMHREDATALSISELKRQRVLLKITLVSRQVVREPQDTRPY
jgi:hypothetical protein